MSGVKPMVFRSDTADGLVLFYCGWTCFIQGKTPGFEELPLSLPHEREAAVRRVVNREPRKPARPKASHAQPPYRNHRIKTACFVMSALLRWFHRVTTPDHCICSDVRRVSRRRERQQGCKVPKRTHYAILGVCLQPWRTSSDNPTIAYNIT
jgi:hypothetical protein